MDLESVSPQICVRKQHVPECSGEAAVTSGWCRWLHVPCRLSTAWVERCYLEVEEDALSFETMTLVFCSYYNVVHHHLIQNDSLKRHFSFTVRTTGRPEHRPAAVNRPNNLLGNYVNP